jgi:transcription antitermination factor NusA-like protein
MHISISRGKFARAISTQARNVRVAIWLAGWHIEIYEECGAQHPRFRRAMMPDRTGARFPGVTRTS